MYIQTYMQLSMNMYTFMFYVNLTQAWLLIKLVPTLGIAQLISMQNKVNNYDYLIGNY